MNDGTLCRQTSAKPGILDSLGSGLSQAFDTATEWFDETTERAGEYVSGQSKSLVLTLIDSLPVKEDSPYSTALLKHYVEGSGAPYVIDPVPVQWQDWIVKATHGRPGHHRSMDPYNSGLFDLRNSLGHFDVDVSASHGGKKRYALSDVYEFGYKKKDRLQQGRHGFPIGALSESQLQMARSFLPSTKYKNPGGFEETWEIRRIAKTNETILLIPQKFLDEQGRKFKVTGVFDR